MIEVFYTRFSKQLPAEIYQHLLTKLSPEMRQRVASFRKWEDAHRSLLGKALLLHVLKQYNLPELSLAAVNYTPFQKPYFNNSIHFNISHSGQYVVCAVSASEVGIDIEEIKNIPLSDFSELFSTEELKLIYTEPIDYNAFYTLWTQKEAFLKALGVGLNLPLNQVIINNNTIEYSGSTWYLEKIAIQTGYICHVVTGIPNVQINLREIHF